jgi:hypothetical protein
MGAITRKGLLESVCDWTARTILLSLGVFYSGVCSVGCARDLRRDGVWKNDAGPSVPLRGGIWVLTPLGLF